SLVSRFAHRTTACNFKGHGGRVDVMIGAVDEINFKVDDRETNQSAAVSDRLDPLFNGRNIFARYVTTLDQVIKLKACPTLARLDNNLDASVLARATRLLLMGIIDFHLALQAFAIGNLRSANIRFNLEFASHAI